MALQQVLHQLELATQGQGFTRLDRQINQWLRGTGLWQGMLHLTCLHTSCSLTINENADPRVLNDLADWMADIVPEERRYSRADEGADAMPAHIRTALTAQTRGLPGGADTPEAPQQEQKDSEKISLDGYSWLANISHLRQVYNRSWRNRLAT